MDFSVLGIFQARVLEWGAIAFSNTMFRIDKFIEMADWTLSGVEGKRE